MLLSLFTLIVGTLCDLLALAFLARFVMQWARAPFANPFGRFVVAVTDWAVRPARRLVPGLRGLDIASLLIAWVLQATYIAVVIGITGAHGGSTGTGLAVAAVTGMLETLRLAIYLAMGAVIAAALLSWVNPHAPLAPLFNQLAQPLLRPVRRLIPPIGGVDLSPVFVLVGLQALLVVIGHLRGLLLPLLAA